MKLNNSTKMLLNFNLVAFLKLYIKVDKKIIIVVTYLQKVAMF